MTRDELQQELRKISERKEQEIMRNECTVLQIQEQYKQVVNGLEARRCQFMQTLREERSEAEKAMRKASADERVRHRTAGLALEDLRQQLYADYKAQKPEAEADNG